MPSGDHQPFWLVRRDQVGQRPQAVGERRRGARAIDEDQPVPFLDGQLDQAPRRSVKAGPALESGGGPQSARERIGPGVIRADDRVALLCDAAGEQFMTAMPAAVGEGTQDAVVTADEQHAPGTSLLGALIAWLSDLRAVPGTKPAPAEEVSLFPGEHRRVHVGGPGQHPAFTERPQRGREPGLIDGRTRIPGLTDHTVKSRQARAGCPGSAARQASQGPAGDRAAVLARAAGAAPGAADAGGAAERPAGGAGPSAPARARTGQHGAGPGAADAGGAAERPTPARARGRGRAAGKWPTRQRWRPAKHARPELTEWLN